MGKRKATDLEMGSPTRAIQMAPSSEHVYRLLGTTNMDQLGEAMDAIGEEERYGVIFELAVRCNALEQRLRDSFGIHVERYLPSRKGS